MGVSDGHSAFLLFAWEGSLALHMSGMTGRSLELVQLIIINKDTSSFSKRDQLTEAVMSRFANQPFTSPEGAS